MKSLFERYKELKINGLLIGLEQVKDIYTYFCYPTNAKAIGFEGCVMYCLIEPYGDMVFACNPDTCTDIFVYPLAKNFEDFISLILTCGSTNPIEQVVWMNKEQFLNHLQEEAASRTDEREAVLQYLNHSPIKNPFDYIKELQANFDNSCIQYSSEYYDVLGIERK